MSLDKKIILGIPTLSVTTGEGIRLLNQKVQEGQKTMVGFLNAHTAFIAAKSKDVSSVLQRFTIFNDGLGIDIASWLKYGTAFSDNLNGTDFTPLYLAKSTNRFRIFLLGARAEVVEKAAQYLTETYPQHRVVGFCDGYSHCDETLPERIRHTEADLILVAMGNPLQELWVAENFEKTDAVMAMCVGALFDFFAGRMPRAPRLLQRLRCEWLFRLCCEPRRLWGRYTAESLLFLLYALWDGVKYRLLHR
ncbi:MAG: WecB/TagA/CpsF family glycosyltransferase [Alphaproteobacteria bacterium]|nr:WecB/TagA/CpsF family glycosyltransferase [Alphaproteobacteria bacterium]